MNGKEAMSFLHDSNSRHDPKMLKLWTKFDYQGIGIFWCIVEILREQPDFKYSLDDIHLIGIELRVDKVLINDLIRYCLQPGVSLFIEQDGWFFSESLLRRMEKFKSAHLRMSMGGKLGMENRYSKGKSKVDIATLKGGYKVGCKVKEKKTNKSSLNSIEFKIELLKKDKEKIMESLKKVWFEKIQFYMEKYPRLDYNLELEKMDDWIGRNIVESKKRTNWNLFIQSWLGRAKQNFNNNPKGYPAQKVDFSETAWEKIHRYDADEDENPYTPNEERLRLSDLIADYEKQIGQVSIQGKARLENWKSRLAVLKGEK